MSSPAFPRRATVAAAVALGLVVPAFVSDYLQSLAAYGMIAGIVVLSLVVLTGYVGQISFCQYSFAALGAFTVGSLVDGQQWNIWAALALGVAFAAAAGVLVGIPALRLSGLFLAILTVAVALLFDRFVLAPGTWNAFSAGISSWRVTRPHVVGVSMADQYAFYLFVLGVFCIVTWGVWNLRKGKTGRMLRAVRESEVAASTLGINLTAWKLAAFALSAGIAGLAGGLLAMAVGSVSPGSFGFLHSVGAVAVATVFGVRSLWAAPLGGLFLIGGPELLSALTPLSPLWFDLIIGALLILQLIFTPDGIVPDVQHRLSTSLPRREGTSTQPAPEPPPAEPTEAEEQAELARRP